jgi:hypothetical protein
VSVTRVKGTGIQITNLSKNGTAPASTQVNGIVRNVFVTG